MSVAAPATPDASSSIGAAWWSSPRLVPLRWSLARRLEVLVTIDLSLLTELEPPAVRRDIRVRSRSGLLSPERGGHGSQDADSRVTPSARASERTQGTSRRLGQSNTGLDSLSIGTLFTSCRPVAASGMEDDRREATGLCRRPVAGRRGSAD
jgi:hypothetical protein